MRLSRDKDDSTSVERQRAAVDAWAVANGHDVVGWAEDLDVSGSVSPWDRPGLGPWLYRSGEYDVICAWKLDRLSRRVLDLSRLIEWSQQRGKVIASATEGLDVTTPMGRVFVQILAALAEGELEAIRARAKASANHLTRVGRWRGGLVPYGYQAVKADEGYRLEIDPETSTTLREIVRRVIAGESTNAVTRWLNAEKVPSPMDAQRVRTGQEPTGAEWRVGNLIKMLRSHTLLGQGESHGRIVRGEDGLPLQRAEPLFDRAEWETLQRVLDGNANKSVAALGGVGYPGAGVVGASGHRPRDRGGRYARPDRCPRGPSGDLLR